MPTDNEIVFFAPSYSLKTSEFETEDYKVTGEQVHLLSQGQILHHTFYPKPNASGFHFEVDRRGSTAVAEWWNQHIKPSETTFNHEPDELNFAVTGTLRLQCKVGDKFDVLDFHDVFLAQGHSGLMNNWWFGILGATYVGSHEITTLDSERRCQFTFRRGGGSPVNVVDVSWSERESPDCNSCQLVVGDPVTQY